jgi:hypothetical protein
MVRPLVADEPEQKRLSDEVTHLRAGGASNLDAAIDDTGAPRGLPTHAGGHRRSADGRRGPRPNQSASPPGAFSFTRRPARALQLSVATEAPRSSVSRTQDRFVPSGPAGADRVRRLAELALAPRIENVRFDVEGSRPRAFQASFRR